MLKDYNKIKLLLEKKLNFFMIELKEYSSKKSTMIIKAYCKNAYPSLNNKVEIITKVISKINYKCVEISTINDDDTHDLIKLKIQSKN